MLTAVLVGLIGSSALVFGGVLGSYWRPPRWVTGVFLAFASGTLISALAFELFPEAVELAGVPYAAAGLFVGAATFVVINAWLDSRVASGAQEPGQEAAKEPAADSMAGAKAAQTEKVEQAADEKRPGGPAGAAIGFALLAAVTLDGVPENTALGVSLIASADAGITAGSLALLFAIFASNFPEAMVGAIAMRAADRSPRFAITLWTAAAVLLTIAVIVGYAALRGVDETALGFALAFAGGAVLASLADTLMPEAFERGRPVSALATALGFLVSFVLAEGF
ncbi:MAG: zinc permease [Geodermatophilaceae bacterium]|nr:zinc permease [Geodermatophilaceae bacterium]MDQ3476322.1 zinc permease [Actinomycetota bacterium]